MSKTYIISGAGSGIGKAIAENLAENGHSCILLGRDISKLGTTAAGLKGTHRFLSADIRSVESLTKAFDSISEIKVDGLIANAGIGGENNWGKSDRWDDIISTNLTGTYNFINTFLPLLVKSDSEFKQIVLTSSVLARLGVANYSAYCASKAGLLGLMRSWAIEFAPENILVNAICPGWVDTEMSQEGLQGIADGLGMSKNDFYNIAMRSVPLGKMSQPEEIADLVAYLLKQKSISGQALDINNGAIMNS
ncbi:MAG: SDR family NAD(P)-dependent oxidoreductase [Daejeonella sp.]